MLLLALRLGAETRPEESIDSQLDGLLRCFDANELVSRHLDYCASLVARVSLEERTAAGGGGGHMVDNEDDEDADGGRNIGGGGIFGKAMTALFASRSGLCEDEVWGIVEMVARRKVSDKERAAVHRILTGT